MAKQEKITVEGTEIRFFSEGDNEFISLTDIARPFSDRTEVLIQNWLRNRNTVEFLGLWERLHNPDFNHIEFDVVKNRTGLNSFTLSPTEWVGATGAIGLRTRFGRYGGGTFGHRDIALEFGSWISPAFKLLILKEFQRLKNAESRLLGADWDLRRALSKINYRIHADAVRSHLVPPRIVGTRAEGLYFASEADLLNLAVFGLTAKEWQLKYPDLSGNMRDHATAEQLLALANLESINAEFIRQGLEPAERLGRLNEIAIYQMQLLIEDSGLKKLESGE